MALQYLECERIRMIVTRESRHIYTSVARKLEREVVRRYSALQNPYLDERDGGFWRGARGALGIKLLKRFLESTFALSGWNVTLTVRNHRHLFLGRHADISVNVKGIDTPFNATVELPVAQVPVWFPRRYGGVWSVIEVHEQGNAFEAAQSLKRHLGRFINDHYPKELQEFVVSPTTNSIPILLTPHVCRITCTDITPFKAGLRDRQTAVRFNP